MITLTKSMLIMITFMTTSSINPLKMSMILLITSCTLFIMLSEIKSIWFASIFLLLFMGGILIMFMILSSLMPNEKSMKMKYSMISMIFILIMTITPSSNLVTSMNESSIKWAMQSSMSLKMMILLILLYFFSFINLLSSEKISMRTTW